MNKYSKEGIVRMVEEEDVEFIRLRFTDILGMLKNMAITPNQLNKTPEDRYMFDGPAIEGPVRTDESDTYLYPDLDTFEIFPWRPQQGKVVRLICNVYNPDGTAFTGDPRNASKWAVEKARDMGFMFNIRPKCEFLLFHAGEEGRPTTDTHEAAGYFGVSPIGFAENMRRGIVLDLEEMGSEVRASHHEIASAQHETDFQYIDALCTANNTMIFKMAAKTIAKHHDLHATFMLKPKESVNGSGMHINMSLSDMLGKNLSVGGTDILGPSAIVYYFMAGILHHTKPMTTLTNPLVNSYKRLMPGYDVPIYIAWSPISNRSFLIRVPSPRGRDTRIELRRPDFAVNPYLALAACLCAGLNEVEKKMALPVRVEGSMFTMGPEEMRSGNMECIPETLGDAIETYEGDSFIRGALGGRTYTKYLEAKEKEWCDFKARVTDQEISEYLYKYWLLTLSRQGTWK